MAVERFASLGSKLATSLNKIVTAVVELIDDHATFKTVVDELVADHATFKTAVDDTKEEMTNLCLSSAGLAIGVGSKKEVLIANTVTYLIDGVFKSKTTAEKAFTATTHDIADGSERVYVYSLDGSGNVTVTAGTAAVGQGNATIPDGPAGECVIGHLRLFANGAIFDATSDDLDAAHLTDTYTNVAFLPQAIGAAPATLSAAGPATLSASDPDSFAS